MTEPAVPPPPPSDPPPTVASPEYRESFLVRAGGLLGIVGCCAGFVIFFAACAGAEAVFKFSLAPVALGGAGMLLTVLVGVIARDRLTEDTHVMAALFANLCSVLGGVLEVAAWRHWRVFH